MVATFSYSSALFSQPKQEEEEAEESLIATSEGTFQVRCLCQTMERTEQLNWKLPNTCLLWSHLYLIFPVGLSAYLTMQVMACIEGTAVNNSLILGLLSMNALVWASWLIIGVYLARGVWSSDSVSSVSHEELEGAHYDGNGDWYCKEAIEADPEAECTMGGMGYKPRIRCGYTIKLSFRVQLVLKSIDFALSIARGILIENGEGQGDYYKMLTLIATIPGSFLILDMIVSCIFGGEHSLTSLIGRGAYVCTMGEEPPFEPVDGLVHDAQQFIMGVEISSWSVIISLLHRRYDMQVTSSWVCPLFSSCLALVYTITAVHHKCCPAAYLVGSVRSLFGPLSPHRFKEGIEVRGISYSVWGPFNMQAVPTPKPVDGASGTMTLQAFRPYGQCCRP